VIFYITTALYRIWPELANILIFTLFETYCVCWTIKTDFIKFSGYFYHIVMSNRHWHSPTSWGTLGLITEVSLKVLPIAPAEATLMCAGLSQKTALNLLHRWGGQPLPLNASAWVRDASAQPEADYLFVRLRGALAAVQSALGKMHDDAVALGAQVQQMDNTEAAQDWRASGEQCLQFFDAPSTDLCLWRLSLPQTAPVLDLPYAQYVEWQGAQRWLWAPASAAVALRELAQSVGGHASLFRASSAHADVDKAVGVNTPLDLVQQRIQRQLQKQLDPKGVFATGRLHPN
jgi:glycolate oxidase FAD binding subunit